MNDWKNINILKQIQKLLKDNSLIMSVQIQLLGHQFQPEMLTDLYGLDKPLVDSAI